MPQVHENRGGTQSVEVDNVYSFNDNESEYGLRGGRGKGEEGGGERIARREYTPDTTN